MMIAVNKDEWVDLAEIEESCQKHGLIIELLME